MKQAYGFSLLFLLLTTVATSLAGEKNTGIILGPVEHGKLVDGVYEGSHGAGLNKALVRVIIENQEIVDIRIVKHRAWKGKKAEAIISKRIMDKQSTAVDAVTGATNSSRVIMTAIQKAIEKAYQN